MTSAVVDAALALAPDLLESALARVPEDQWFERKSARVSPRDLAVPLVAMANADGGVIVVGMHDGVLEDVPPQRRNAIRQAAMDFTQPPVRMHVEELSVGGDDPRTVMVLRVEPGETVHHTHKGDCYLRIGDESRKLTAAQERELVYDRGAAQYEASPTTLGIDDLDPQSVEHFDRVAALLGGGFGCRRSVRRSRVGASFRHLGELRIRDRSDDDVMTLSDAAQRRHERVQHHSGVDWSHQHHQ